VAKVGRKSKLTPEVTKIILETLRVGATFEAAAGRAGVDVSTIHHWRRSGKAEDGEGKLEKTPELVEFALAVDRAIAEAETRLVGLVNRAAPKQWQAAAWILERRWAGQYGSKQKIDMDANVTQRPPREEMDELLAKVAAALKGDAVPR
jgi:hypothetical protein